MYREVHSSVIPNNSVYNRMGKKNKASSHNKSEQITDTELV